MKLVLASLFLDHLDLNGDQANLRVIAKRAQWRGIEVEIVNVQKGESVPENADLIFIGHGSRAAWSDLNSEFEQIHEAVRSQIENGAFFMAVASGFEKSVNLGWVPGRISETERVSKFEIVQANDFEILGYVNSASGLPLVDWRENVLATLLHGPFLAKNPEVADRVIAQMLTRRGFELPGDFVTEEANAAAAFIDEMVADVWQLERELASE